MDPVGHLPVLLEESIALLDPRPNADFIDCTSGAGGHSTALLDRTGPRGRLLALDADPAAVEQVRVRLRGYGDRARVVQSNFRDLAAVAEREGFAAVDGIVMDLGMSSRQIEQSGRGFSFRRDEQLDMRYDPSQTRTAADVLASASRDEIAGALRDFGEEPHSLRIANAIVAARAREPLRTTQQLASLVSSVVGRSTGRIHPATRTFQALRILTNDELGALRETLPQAIGLLRRGGRLAVISFHSLEDRIVKSFMRREAGLAVDTAARHLPVPEERPRPRLRILTRRPLTPTADEVARNPRSRSARLRVAERI
ncbi:MAG TPA: 16S rRNA (cytosine(1402)-N(4))-methyltransferase RsmH [Chloroflexota bacterium]|nr:16S rRNA (cytosine(1402)-N(4))-methyltransferase RsmH [Chloroflexota bacterium]